MASAWGKSWGFSWGNSWGTVDTSTPAEIVPEPYSTEDGFSRAKFIDLQNKALINMLTTFVASGALE